MTLWIQARRAFSLCLAACCMTGELPPVIAAEQIIVLVQGAKPADSSTHSGEPQLLNNVEIDSPEMKATARTRVVRGDVTTLAGPIAPQRQLTELDKLVEEAISVTSRRYLKAEEHSPWQIFHGLLALRHNFKLKVNDEKQSAMNWVQSGPNYQGLPLIEQTPHGGRFHPYTVPWAFEGHPNQFLAILAMSELPQNFAFRAGNGAKITIADMIRNAKMDCNDREEVTWTLWAFARYLPWNTQWVNKEGEVWSMERLVQTEVNKRVQSGACGGCHGLFALSLARNSYQQSGQPLRGAWLQADLKIKQYIAETKALQNFDGSFSADHYIGPKHTIEFSPRIAASGHILEWLMIGIPSQEMEQEWLKRGVTAIARDLIENKAAPADCGPLYHALHSLVLYRHRTRPELADPAIVEVPVVPPPPAVIVPKPVAEPKLLDPKPQEPKRVETQDAKPLIDAKPAVPAKTPIAAPKIVTPEPAASDEVKPLFSKPVQTAPTVPEPQPAKPTAPPKPEPTPTPAKPKVEDSEDPSVDLKVPLPPTDD